MLEDKIKKAAKWSLMTEIAAKIMGPVTYIVLARILVPEAFGVVATVSMITTFADMFTDAGFSKYLVQHEFLDEEEKHKHANVAFWTNFVISAVLWGILALCRNPVAVLVGSPGLGYVIAIACVQLPLTSFSSIQMALYRRDFDFKTLFGVRIAAICIPFAITIPLALAGFNYWAMIIGAICVQLSNALILTVKSKWKPKLFYKIKILKEMLSFGIWSLIEEIALWFNIWVDVFIIGSFLNQYYLGLYQMSITMVNGLMSVIAASTVSVLFSALSRLKNDEGQFKIVFFKIQRLVSIFVFPLGAGLFIFGGLAAEIFLGSKWIEAGGVIGIYALIHSMLIVFGYYSNEVYRAKGKPKMSFLAQSLHLVVLIPVCLISIRYGFWAFVNARSLIILELVLVHLIIMKVTMNIPIGLTIKNIFPTLFSAAIMGVLGYFLREGSKGYIFDLISIIICVLVYFAVLYLFPDMRRDLKRIVKKGEVRMALRKT